MIAPGLRSKFFITIAMISTSVRPERDPVPYVSTKTDRGYETPMAYESCTRTLWQMPAATRDLATQRAA